MLAMELAMTQRNTMTSSHFLPLMYFISRSMVRFASLGF